jgi:hypothetical protein
MISIPVFGGVIGYVINWTGVWMLYRPLQFVGFHVPGLLTLVRHLPGKLRTIPGLKEGGIGWQGIIPSRAGKLASIAVDKQIVKIGSPADFYEQLDIEEVAEQIGSSLEDELRERVDEVMEREYPEVWEDLPPQARERLHAKVRDELPAAAREIALQIGRRIDELVDIKLMVIRLLQERPELTNRLFHEVGAKEFRFIINFGFVFGFLLGLPTILLVEAFPHWWVLPLAQAVIGYATNWTGIYMIYEPVESKKVGPFRWQGLFLRRQHEASEVYGKVISEEIITVGNIGEELMHGPRSDRTRELIADVLRPVIDRSAGSARAVVRPAVGSARYESARDALVDWSVEHTLAPLEEPEFSRRKNQAISDLFTERMRDFSPQDFAETMRSATRQDEWLLVVHGAVFGIFGGVLHYIFFGL